MSKIIRLEYNFKASRIIIVGYKKGDRQVKIDGIVLHTAFTLSDDVSLLENIKITSQDKMLVICGHGSKSKLTIGGRKIADLADDLIKAGYTGQPIYLTSCESALINKQDRMSIAENLENELKDRLEENTENSNMSIDEKVVQQEMLAYKLVYSDAVGVNITIKNEDSGASIFILEGLSKEEGKRILKIQNSSRLYKDSKGLIVNISTDNLEGLLNLNNKHYKDIQELKETLLIEHGLKKPTLRYLWLSLSVFIKYTVLHQDIKLN